MENLLLHPGHLQHAKGHRFAAVSGALTVIATTEDVYALQNAATSKPFVVTLISLDWWTTTGFTTAQAVPWGLWKVSGFTSIHSAGTGIKTIAPHRKRNTNQAALASVNCRMANAVKITTATYTALTASEPDYVLNTTVSTTPVGSMVWSPGEGLLPAVLDESEGFICQPLVTMGAAGVGQLSIRIEGHTLEGESIP